MSKPFVLVVDDEPDIQIAVAEYLNDDFKVLRANDGLDALRALENNRVDLVITDYNMRGLDGFELIRSMHESNIKVPVIVLTGRGSQELQVQSMAYNVFEYIEKPFHLKYLKNAAQKCLMYQQDHKQKPTGPNVFSRMNFEDIHLKLSISMVTRLRDEARSQGLSVNAYIEKILNEQLNLELD